MMSHKEFILAYEGGSFGCCIDSLLILRLFLTGHLREKTASISLIVWSLYFPILIIPVVIWFFFCPFLWALFGSILTLMGCLLALFYWLGDLILSLVLANEEFYEFAIANRVLRICLDDEEKETAPEKAVPLPHARYHRRRL
jgi:hypothetical protein